MLEKIGLPSKPSARGSNWVVDASHCQGCSSQFTFIYRKHHCRRCGGLFCNSCTQGRMVLRGQGDSPVRVCEPCKKLEEASRFELRYGHKSRTAGGSLRSTSKYENEVLNQILGNYSNDMVSSINEGTSSASSSDTQGVFTLDGGGEIHRSPSVDESNLRGEMEITSPEELRQQALNEKKKYKTLKGEGKSDEALRAFKRGKELERQAEALEKSIRKNRKKVLLSANVEEAQINDGRKESGKRSKVAPPEGKQKDDLVAELRELGWSDTDLRNEEKKRANISLEGEFSSLIGEISERTNKDKGSNALDKSQVVAHKKRALTLKREGKLAEAKEELKKAKVLEKQLEEQELLAEAEDSDDELSALIRSMDNDKQEEFSLQDDHVHDFDFNHLIVAAEDLATDGNFEVTDDDMEDPEIANALKSLGWSEDSKGAEASVPQFVSADKETLLSEILSLKREALSQKRAGNVAEAMAQLKKAKLLERDLEGFESQDGKIAEDRSRVQKDSTAQAADKPSKSFVVRDGNTDALKEMDSKLKPRSKVMIQKELLGLKKKALTLRREGRMDEAEEELKRGRVLEHQLEEMENDLKVKPTSMSVSYKDSNLANDLPDISGNLPTGDEEEEDVTDQDMHDPTYLSLLKNLGWNEQENQLGNLSSEPHKQSDNPSMKISEPSVTQALPYDPFGGSRRSKAEMQRELLGLKRKALALRRKGETEEAEELLRMAKTLEAQMTEMEAPKKEVESNTMQKENVNSSPPKNADEEVDVVDVSENDMHDPSMLSMLESLGWNEEEPETVTMNEKSKKIAANSLHSADPSLVESSSIIAVATQKSKAEIQRELLNLKRKALVLRRKGETKEAEELMRMVKVLEAQMEEKHPERVHPHDALENDKSEGFGSLINQEKQENPKDAMEITMGLTQARVSPNDEVVKLSAGLGIMESNKENPRSGTLEGTGVPEPEFWHNAGTLEGTSIPQADQSTNLIDLLTGDDWRGSQTSERQTDMSNYHSDGSFLNSPLQSQTLTSSSEDLASKSDVKTERGVLSDDKPHFNEANYVQEHASQKDQSTLQQDILAHKRKAVALKREGKLAEAREELRNAKLLEKHLEKDNPETKTSSSPVTKTSSSPETKTSSSDVSVSTSNVPSVSQKTSGLSNNIQKPLTSRDRFKLQQESLGHKRQALKLRREGRVAEAEAEFELAKALETQLEELSGHDATNSSVVGVEDDMGVDDLLDPQLLSALKAIGIEETNAVSRGPERPQPSKLNFDKDKNSNQDRIQLEEQIKAEKLKAVNLKRSGKQAEALDALRRAKLFEKKLNALPLQ
ncbi:hypothetical protein FNV43_RR07719 [Rhamnella rubrinervis]|uniref:FYVE-type domain-containing protein n=1 Tax=Rhamnella rubrinervis TaxID=2594499 RepID=A0A8K0MMP2_9ROSA|nr:hypothetical protein FNV43_RR07719 [Rhamnella rubrinervis]